MNKRLPRVSLSLVITALAAATASNALSLPPIGTAVARPQSAVKAGRDPLAVADYVVTVTATSIAVTDTIAGSDTMTISQPNAGTDIKFAVTGKTFSVNGGAATTDDSGSLSLSGITSVSVDGAAGNDIFNISGPITGMASFTLNGGTGDDTINLNSGITFLSNANLDVDLQNDSATPGVDTILEATAGNLILSGTGTATFKASKNIQFAGHVSTQNGNVTIENNQQATPSSGNFMGVNVLGTSVVESTGTGAINILARGGTDTTAGQYGFRTNTGALVRGGTAGNAVTITGVGGPSGGTLGNNGIFIPNGSVRSLGGNILFTGVGSATGTGVTIQNSGIVQPGAGGNIVIDAAMASPTAGVAAFNLFTVATNPTGPFTTGGGNITIIADSVSISTTNNFSFVNAGTGTVTFRPKTNATSIDIGSTAGPTANVLELSDAELDRVVAGMLQIGDNNSGSINITNVISPAAYTTLGIGNAVNFTSTGGFASDITSSTVYEKMSVNGAVLIDPNATLSVATVGGYTPTATDYFWMLSNISANPTTGAFAGKPEGSTVSINGVNKPISYMAGPGGNDVVIGIAPAGTTAAKVRVTGRVTDARGVGLRGARVSITDSRGNSFSAVTNAFGYYAIGAVASGDSYLATASAKGYAFAPQVVPINDTLAQLDFVPGH